MGHCNLNILEYFIIKKIYLVDRGDIVVPGVLDTFSVVSNKQYSGFGIFLIFVLVGSYTNIQFTASPPVPLPCSYF